MEFLMVSQCSFRVDLTLSCSYHTAEARDAVGIGMGILTPPLKTPRIYAPSTCLHPLIRLFTRRELFGTVNIIPGH